MSAAPFGGHPTLAEYLRWLTQQGFFYSISYATGNNHLAPIIDIRSSSGKHLHYITDMDMSERLVPTSVGRLDRVLGVDAPFSKL